MRPALCEDALRLGRVLAGLLPKEPEVHGLIAREDQAAAAFARAAELTGNERERSVLRRAAGSLEGRAGDLQADPSPATRRI